MPLLNDLGLTSKELDAERAKWPKETVQLWQKLSKKEANGKHDPTPPRHVIPECDESEWDGLGVF